MAPTRHRLVSRGGAVAAMFAGLLGAPHSVRAQFGPLSSSVRSPQARSQTELDAYLEIVTSKSDEETVKRVETFAAQFPQSELLGVAYQYQMHAYERLGNFDGVLTAGRRGLVIAPANVDALLTLAPTIANHLSDRPDRTALQMEAEGYARHALESLDKVRPPRTVSLDSWETQKHALQCRAHEVLGVIAANRGNGREAVEEFAMVVRLAATPDGSQYFRLGLAFASVGREAEAVENLERAASLGPQSVRQLAAQQIERLKRTQQ